MSNVFERLKIIRKSLGKSQAQLANKCGLAQKDISRLENGKTKFIPNTYLIILDEYGTNLNWLISGEGLMLRKDQAEFDRNKGNSSLLQSEENESLKEKYMEASIENKLLKKQVKELKKEKNVLLETFKVLNKGKLFK